MKYFANCVRLKTAVLDRRAALAKTGSLTFRFRLYELRSDVAIHIALLFYFKHPQKTPSLFGARGFLILNEVLGDGPATYLRYVSFSRHNAERY